MNRAQKMIGVLVAAAAAVLAASSPAGATTFRGSCALRAEVTFGRPIPVVPQARHEQSDIGGTCFGRLNGRMLPAKGARIQGHAVANQVLSCAVGGLPNQYGAELSFRQRPGSSRPARLFVHAIEADPLPKGALVVRGVRGGLAHGTASLQGGAPVFEQCLAGKLDRATVAFKLTTIRPLDG